MSFELPRAARQLRFTGAHGAGGRAAPGAWETEGPRDETPSPVLARPRPNAIRQVAQAFEPEDEQPTRVHAPSAPPEPAPRPAPRPIPNFRPALPAPVLVEKRPSSRARRSVKTGPSSRKRSIAARGVPMVAWLVLAVLGGALSFHVAPPLVDRLALLAPR